tara:strand:+ start:7538 stop:8107 length:570 start_codon:yes stop_codon:yes gene_type:complete
MLVDYVNDAKTLVENAYDWTGLRSTITVPTVASTTNYSLLGSGSRLKLLNVLNDTGNNVMKVMTQVELDMLQTINTQPEGQPYKYIFRGTDSNGDLTVDLYPVPDAVYSIDFNGIKPQPTLVASTDDDTALLVPSEPVLHLVLALAVRERGETGGTSAQEHFAIADQFLLDAIALDAARHFEDAIWYTV